MVIETKRLKIIALTQEQLEILVDHIPEFEKKLNCSYQGEKIEGIFKNILYEQSLKIETNRDAYLWLTFWLIEAFCAWGKKQASVKHIIAETEIDNFSSQRVLQRNGFVEYFRDKTIWWKL